MIFFAFCKTHTFQQVRRKQGLLLSDPRWSIPLKVPAPPSSQGANACVVSLHVVHPTTRFQCLQLQPQLVKRFKTIAWLQWLSRKSVKSQGFILKTFFWDLLWTSFFQGLYSETASGKGVSTEFREFGDQILEQNPPLQFNHSQNPKKKRGSPKKTNTNGNALECVFRWNQCSAANQQSFLTWIKNHHSTIEGIAQLLCIGWI